MTIERDTEIWLEVAKKTEEREELYKQTRRLTDEIIALKNEYFSMTGNREKQDEPKKPRRAKNTASRKAD